MDKPVNFYEIDKQGNHVIRICGGDEESKKRRGDLMRASEDMYIILKEAKIQLEYLHEKFKATGSGNQVLAKIESILNKIESRII